MTINIAIAVSEGLVMAADSLSQMANENGSPRSVHQSVEKITEIRGRAIALMVNGLGEIKRRTIISLIREFEFTQYNSDAAIQRWTLIEFASHLCSFLKQRYEDAFPSVSVAHNSGSVQSSSLQARPELGIIVGGYSPGKFFPEVVEINFPGPVWKRIIPSADGEPQGEERIKFWGHLTAVNRLVAGYDPKRIEELKELVDIVENLRNGKQAGALTFEKLPDEYRSLPSPRPDFLRDFEAIQDLMQMNHRLRGMPLQEAVEFVEYLGNVAIGYDRFCMGVPIVGGELDVVAIQADGLHWYKRKPFLKQMADAREQALEAEDRQKFHASLMDNSISTIGEPGTAGDDTSPP